MILNTTCLEHNIWTLLFKHIQILAPKKTATSTIVNDDPAFSVGVKLGTRDVGDDYSDAASEPWNDENTAVIFKVFKDGHKGHLTKKHMRNGKHFGNENISSLP